VDETDAAIERILLPEKRLAEQHKSKPLDDHRAKIPGQRGGERQS
jgi:hypothetical protein|tara:strand:- start:2826 stop:2960 length:135 start_codon:yes stop_codon:yes gene_type:complete